MKVNILKILFIAWIALWAVFFVRELFIKNALAEYKALLGRTLEGKHSFLVGDKLYGLLKRSMAQMPEKASYKLVGVEDGSVERVRAAYYLYPHIETSEADFIIDASRDLIEQKKE